MTIQRALIVMAVLALPCALAPAASAQDWPNKPVRILIGFGAGGGTDVATRILADGALWHLLEVELASLDADVF